MKYSVLFAVLVCLLTTGVHAQVRKCIGSGGKAVNSNAVCAEIRADNSMLLRTTSQILAQESSAARRAGLADYNENPMKPDRVAANP